MVPNYKQKTSLYQQKIQKPYIFNYNKSIGMFFLYFVHNVKQAHIVITLYTIIYLFSQVAHAESKDG